MLKAIALCVQLSAETKVGNCQATYVQLKGELLTSVAKHMSSLLQSMTVTYRLALQTEI